MTRINLPYGPLDVIEFTFLNNGMVKMIVKDSYETFKLLINHHYSFEACCQGYKITIPYDQIINAMYITEE